MCVTGVAHVKVYDFTYVLQVRHMSRCMILHVTGIVHVKVYDLTCYRYGTCQVVLFNMLQVWYMSRCMI